MAGSVIIDRRKNPGGKSTSNRHRFIKRAKDAIRKSIKDRLQGRKIDNTDAGENVNIPSEGIREPSFGHDSNTGKKTDIRPGNKDFNTGDRVAKPPEGGGGGPGGRGGSNGPETMEEEFEFTLSKKEFDDIFFEDLELPNLKDKEMNETKQYKNVREGHRKNGNMANLDLVRSYKNSLGRRIALDRPDEEELEDLKKQLEKAKNKSKSDRDDLIQKIEEIQQKFRAVPFFDETDLRFRNFVRQPQPNSKAVMFCVMDVSASMGEHEKDLSKRFFMLLYRFLIRKYEQTEIVFIRHHVEAKECDEEEFFHSRETGGTVVSSAIDTLLEIQKDRYPTNEWNIYVAQCSDGDNYGDDNTKLITQIQEEVMPMCQYYAYIQTEYHRSDYRGYFDASYGLWANYQVLNDEFRHFQMKQVGQVTDIWKVFVDLFKKREA
jgi:uncharacterized sporulation protein YeaH/YhbH (DUF444 family)